MVDTEDTLVLLRISPVELNGVLTQTRVRVRRPNQSKQLVIGMIQPPFPITSLRAMDG